MEIETFMAEKYAPVPKPTVHLVVFRFGWFTRFFCEICGSIKTTDETGDELQPRCWCSATSTKSARTVNSFFENGSRKDGTFETNHRRKYGKQQK